MMSTGGVLCANLDRCKDPRPCAACLCSCISVSRATPLGWSRYQRSEFSTTSEFPTELPIHNRRRALRQPRRAPTLPQRRRGDDAETIRRRRETTGDDGRRPGDEPETTRRRRLRSSPGNQRGGCFSGAGPRGNPRDVLPRPSLSLAQS